MTNIIPWKMIPMNLLLKKYESKLSNNYKMNKKVYFAGSIRGGRENADLFKRIIEYIKRTDIVLTEHIGNLKLSALEQGKDKDAAIYEQDMGWLRESDLVIAECTCPSLGVGYEMAYAEKLNKPCHIMYNRKKTELSAMLTGNPYFNIYQYTDEKEIYEIISKILAD